MSEESHDDWLSAEIAAYTAMKEQLEQRYRGKFVVFHGGKLQESFDTVDAAADFCSGRFEDGTYLIRQVAGAFENVPTSTLYKPLVAA